jgi:hypothetical protein
MTLIYEVRGENVPMLSWRTLERRVLDAELPNFHDALLG